MSNADELQTAANLTAEVLQAKATLQEALALKQAIGESIQIARDEQSQAESDLEEAQDTYRQALTRLIECDRRLGVLSSLIIQASRTVGEAQVKAAVATRAATRAARGTWRVTD